jgi:hypothetical protein
METCSICETVVKHTYDDGYCHDCMTEIMQANLELELYQSNPVQ